MAQGIGSGTGQEREGSLGQVSKDKYLEVLLYVENKLELATMARTWDDVDEQVEDALKKVRWALREEEDK